VRAAARTAGALAAGLGAAGAAADCFDTERIASIGVRDEHVLLLDKHERPFALVEVAAADAARIEAALSVTRLAGRICDHSLFLIADGRLIMARRVLRF
jgi:hypothetical protein